MVIESETACHEIKQVTYFLKGKTACTCGSGAHPRRCVIHPENFQKDIDDINKEWEAS